MTLSELKTALEASGYPFALYGWKNATANTYGVVSQDDAGSIWADGKMGEQSTIGTVDIFTKDASSAPQTAVQTILAGLDVSWYLNSVQYEDDTGYIHFEWVWEAAV